jgi:hypothetical protein
MKTKSMRVDIKKLLETNLFIFKENLKLILTSSRGITSRSTVGASHGTAETKAISSR